MHCFSMFMLLIKMSSWVISAFLLSLAPLLTKSYKGCKCFCANGVNSSKKTSSDSDSDLDTDSTTSLGIEKSSKMNLLSGGKRSSRGKVHSLSLEYINIVTNSELKAATHDFTTSIGQGNASNFYKAKMPNGESLAIKVLATNVRQGKREFQAEHKLACHAGGNHEVLNWNVRHNIALDIASCLEYLHHGTVPPVVHWDIKYSNILLDSSMRARAVINKEGNSGWEELVDSRLEDEYDIQELNGMADLAYRCINSSPINRPSMKDIVQELSQIRNFRNNRAMLDEVPISKYTQDIQNPVAEEGGEEADDTTQVLLRCFSVCFSAYLPFG